MCLNGKGQQGRDFGGWVMKEGERSKGGNLGFCKTE